jgi:hypothetical protein
MLAILTVSALIAIHDQKVAVPCRYWDCTFENNHSGSSVCRMRMTQQGPLVFRFIVTSVTLN